MSRFNFQKTFIKDLYVITPHLLHDSRGYFERFFCKNDFKEVGLTKEILQINHSYTKKKATIRGMHYQENDSAEIKIIRCIKGSVYDVVIDMRQNSSTYLKWFGIELNEKNNKFLYIPEGFAHGFQTLEDNSEVIYLNTAFYTPDSEKGINFKDPLIDIKWPLNISEISEKDMKWALFNDKI